MDQSTKKKLLVAGCGVGLLLVINRAGQVQDTINGLTFRFGVGGAPQISGLSIIFPVRVFVTNPGEVKLPLQGVAMTMERIIGNGIYAPLAATDPAGVVTPSIAARAVTEFVVPVRTDFLSLASELVGIIQARGLGRYRLSSSIISAGIKVHLPAQTLTY